MKKAIDVITTVVIVLLVAVILVLYAPSIFGIKTFSVLSGSMEPEIHVGSIIYVKPVADGEIAEGDVITFYDESGTVVTHRVNELTDDGKVIPKGDANKTPDSAVKREQIIGREVFCIPYLGYCAVFISSFAGKISLVCVVGAALLLIAVSEILSGKNGKDRKNEHQN